MPAPASALGFETTTLSQKAEQMRAPVEANGGAGAQCFTYTSIRPQDRNASSQPGGSFLIYLETRAFCLACRWIQRALLF